MWVKEQLPQGRRSAGGRRRSAVLGTGSADPKEWDGKGENTEELVEAPRASPGHSSHSKGQTLCNLNFFLESPSPNTATQGMMAQPMNLGAHKHPIHKTV